MKRAFTLIELIIVIAILGVFAAILFPFFGNASKNSDKAQAIGCLSHSKQLGMAVLMYSQDYDAHLPPAPKWMTVSMPYLKNSAVYLCPIVQKANPKAPASYAMDSRLSGISFEKLTTPRTRALAYDSTRTDWDATDPGQTFAPRHPHGERHLGNLVYADGHAKPVSVEDFTKAVK